MKFKTLFVVFMSILSIQAVAQNLPSGCDETMSIVACYEIMVQKNTPSPEKIEAEKHITDKKAKEDATKVSKTALSSSTTTDNASSSWDALSLFFGALGVGPWERANDSLTLNTNINIDSAKKFPISVRCLLRKPQIYDKVLAAQPEDQRDTLRKSLEKELGDFDDAEYTIAWSLSKKNASLSSFVDQVSKAVKIDPVKTVRPPIALSDFLTKAKKRLENRANHHDPQAAQLLKKIDEKEIGDWRFEELRELNLEKELKDVIDSMAPAAENAVEVYKTYKEVYSARRLNLLTELASNEYQFRISAVSRQRSAFVGADDIQGSVSWEYGFNPLSKFLEALPDKQKTEKFVGKNNGAISACANSSAHLISIECLKNGLDAYGEKAVHGQRLSFSLVYGKTSRYTFNQPGAVAVNLEPVKTVSGVCAYGQNLRIDKSTKLVTTRLDVEARYDDVTGEEKRNNRLVATATIGQALTDGSLLTFSVVYANKPEYRGDVNKEFSARLGLKWSVTKK